MYSKTRAQQSGAGPEAAAGASGPADGGGGEEGKKRKTWLTPTIER